MRVVKAGMEEALSVTYFVVYVAILIFSMAPHDGVTDRKQISELNPRGSVPYADSWRRYAVRSLRLRIKSNSHEGKGLRYDLERQGKIEFGSFTKPPQLAGKITLETTH